MLDGIVFAQLLQIECVGPVRPSKKVGGELGYEEAERWRKVESLLHSGIQVAKSDISAVVRENAMVRPEAVSSYLTSMQVRKYIAFSIGHADRESPSRGGMYAGHFPAWPGRPAETTSLGA